jgi:hypothetical protein
VCEEDWGDLNQCEAERHSERRLVENVGKIGEQPSQYERRQQDPRSAVRPPLPDEYTDREREQGARVADDGLNRRQGVGLDRPSQ